MKSFSKRKWYKSPSNCLFLQSTNDTTFYNPTNKQIMSGANDNKDPVRVAAGLKGTLARDNVSDEAKARAEERLNEMGYSAEDRASDSTRDAPANEDAASKHEHHVAGGYKATLKNPNVSEEAKQNAREKLDEI
ncbi:hypothetical protein MKEN_01237300 [Mycena kentingensis (nom. inval.)]|nr:hypothetical protein MKEN_01237300 [Mycena kentingensis (nom. inval.)]